MVSWTGVPLPRRRLVANEKVQDRVLADLRQLLRESRTSRMAISTRSTTIARCAGAVVKFGARDALGSVSEQMFMGSCDSWRMCGDLCKSKRGSQKQCDEDSVDMRRVANRSGCDGICCCVFVEHSR